MTISPIILGGVIILWSLVVGLAVIAFGELLLAIREIAMNTRKEGVKTPHYEILMIMAKINNLLGWIFLVAGIALGVYVMITGSPIPLVPKATTTL
jgi:uncharacterized membrane protein SpoIIM required for sporulation